MASNEERPLDSYLGALIEARDALAMLAPWRHYHAQLAAVAGDPPIDRLVRWLVPFGGYVDRERAFVDAEITRVTSGGYLDFLWTAGRL